jgi:hypothetical protein
LAGFLGTFTSRHSDFEGYWLLGFLVTQREIGIDLLAVAPGSDAPVGAARRLAASKFGEQLRKAGLSSSNLRTATLRIERSDDMQESLAGSWRRSGFTLRFRAEVVADNGRKYQREECVFVAPHDPRFESRSVRVSHPENPLQMSGDIVDAAPSGTKAR